MTEFGYALSSEEHGPQDLVRYASLAEQTGFTFALISDHYHPWISRQGHSPFVWSVIGGIAQVTDKLQLGTGVTCPIMRIHPAVIAQAAATAAAMMPGRFFLGVGTGENLNEHITGERWPPHDIRLAMLEEAVEFIRLLWEGETVSIWGDFYTIEDARIYSLPDEPPPIMIAGSGDDTIEAAGRVGDGFISTSPKAEFVNQFQAAGGNDKPCYGQLAVCWARSEEEAIRTVHQYWPNTVLTGELNQELRTVAHFEQAARMASPEEVAKKVICGPDPQRHGDGIQKFIDAGYDHVYIHQIGPDQQGFLDFYQRDILPHLNGK
ncbi:MAG: TIGR03557 family F420-dependent LLM class oxidoreductase [Chloroflexi bacterium]|nr:TIGR03557 family F420-dependent LLM class oxidoreductase [Chloroflexota bacterium]MCI0578367.1 TIGR03557 family F420-dependent LLM class oxidoreductase [Chloroflexota bacterium]MCI0646230.1 TIGR03557 family F420-dependent LLM class oxidoreductase [Chloroflexota bacterium]MCI0732150.1 TIGR03557 family F420-dependent LLM class oxidoreductase [Chloroflexota bacterium]